MICKGVKKRFTFLARHHRFIANRRHQICILMAYALGCTTASLDPMEYSLPTVDLIVDSEHAKSHVSFVCEYCEKQAAWYNPQHRQTTTVPHSSFLLLHHLPTSMPPPPSPPCQAYYTALHPPSAPRSPTILPGRCYSCCGCTWRSSQEPGVQVRNGDTEL